MFIQNDIYISLLGHNNPHIFCSSPIYFRTDSVGGDGGYWVHVDSNNTADGSDGEHVINRNERPSYNPNGRSPYKPWREPNPIEPGNCDCG